MVNVINMKVTVLNCHSYGPTFLPRRHIQLLADAKRISAENELVNIDWVGFAERLINAPYKWGGRSLGLDCSALVQLSLSAGLDVPRDSGPQHEIGAHLNIESAFQNQIYVAVI